MTRTASNAAGVIEEARAHGLDVTAADVDVEALALDVIALSVSHTGAQRQMIVARMNAGLSYAAALALVLRTTNDA